MMNPHSPDAYGLPPLFTLPSELDKLSYATPKSGTPGHTRESLSSRKSLTPAGSIHTADTTTPPGRPPPIMRLTDAIMAEAGDAPGSVTPRGAGAPGGAAAARSTTLMRVDPGLELEDAWVTVFGFSADALPVVLGEFQRCGDILQWGTFGAAPSCNFVHIQFQNHYGAQRALLKSGEQLTPSLIVGVKPLDARHRQQVQAAGGAAGGERGHAGQRHVTPLPARPYKVDVSAGTQLLPQPSRNLLQRVSEFVIGS